MPSPVMVLPSFKNAQLALEELIKTRLWAKLLFALFLGVTVGYVFVAVERKFDGTWAKSASDWIALPGSIYLAAIQMVIIPLVLSSIIMALSGIGKKSSASTIGITAMGFVLVSTFIAAGIGVLVTSLWAPGEALRSAAIVIGEIDLSNNHQFSFSPQMILQFIPTNPLESLLKGDLLEVLVLSVIFGVVISRMDERHSSSLLSFLAGTQALCLQVIAMAMKLAPYAVFGLMLRAVVHAGTQVLMGMMGYLACAFIGFVLMAAVYGVWLAVVLRINPFSFLKKSSESLVLAFSLSSSAATMPTTLRVAKDELGVRDEISQVLVPLGTTINMAGSAIWQTSATMFLAQAFGGEIQLSNILLIVVLTVGASIGTPGVPGAGLGVLSSTLRSVGVPSSGIPLILGVDRLVDMGCTTLNVMGDLVLCLTAEWVIKGKEGGLRSSQ